MSLLVPALRVVMAFTNVWETYKTLKMPPPSPRNGGRPTIRALSQRKRDMKGCLAVWLVFVSRGMSLALVQELNGSPVLLHSLRTIRGEDNIHIHPVLR